MTEQPNTLTLKFPRGVDNRSREYALLEGALRDAVNLDVTRDGGLLARKGLRTVLAGDCHSLFTHPSQRFVLVVIDGYLNRLDPDETTFPLVAVAGPVVYALLNDNVYWTDGNAIGQVTSQGEVGLWGMNTPPAPIVAAVTNGGLYAGTYQVAMTAIHSSGIESGASETVSVEVLEGGGIQVTTPSASGVVFAIYITPPNGSHEELRQAMVMAPGSIQSLGVGGLGKALETLHGERPIPGQCLIQHKGRLWVASGNVVWFTSEKSPHIFYPATGYYLFESAVLLLGAAEDGIYVGLYDRIYYLQGTDPLNMTQRPVSAVGVVARSVNEIPYDLFLGQGAFPSRQCAFYDREGFLCIGKPGGVIIRPTKETYSAGEASSGDLTYRAYEGLRQLVSVLSIEQNTPLMATDTLVSEIFAQGVVLNVE